MYVTAAGGGGGGQPIQSKAMFERQLVEWDLISAWEDEMSPSNGGSILFVVVVVVVVVVTL